jgi:phospholipase C
MGLSSFWGVSYSDNYHQAVMGGTGANHIILGSGDAAFYSDGHGNPLVPPSNQIENPNAKPGTNNNYTQDGYAGGSYSNCSDPNQPGVGPILSYLHALPYQPFRNGDCAPGAYYLLNNYAPGYTPSGQLTTSTPFAVPPQTFPTIADELSAHGISWKYYGQGYNNGTDASPSFCGICDPFQYATSIMTTSLRNNIQDFSQFGLDVANNTVPAVSFIKPDAINDGHPASSSLSLFETFASNIVNEVISRPSLFDSTAIFITFDEGGGYYDSGYIQPLTFFGDGPRVPLIVVSAYAKEGFVDHTYYDHASILKFIERNWGLSPLSARSLDNLPNPTANETNPYQPTNAPAIGDLMHLFNFYNLRAHPPLLPFSA